MDTTSSVVYREEIGSFFFSSFGTRGTQCRGVRAMYKSFFVFRAPNTIIIDRVKDMNQYNTDTLVTWAPLRPELLPGSHTFGEIPLDSIGCDAVAFASAKRKAAGTF